MHISYIYIYVYTHTHETFLYTLSAYLYTPAAQHTRPGQNGLMVACGVLLAITTMCCCCMNVRRLVQTHLTGRLGGS